VKKWYDEAPRPELPPGRQTLRWGVASAEEVQNLALALLLLWGPSTRLPVEQRLMAFVADLDHERAATLVQEAKRAEERGHAYVWERHEASGNGEDFGSQEEMAQAVVEHCPWVDDDNLRQLYTQSCYYAWHG
jgi:hypothetical protein